jgi:hypothetical protein
MSMKRSKQRSSGSSRLSGGGDDETHPWAKPTGPEPTWSDVESKPDESCVAFTLSARYAKGDFIMHPKFGKGLVLSAEPTRIEVLFKDGKKKLGHAVS